MSREFDQDIRAQHQKYMRSGYDGHNRRSGFTTMDDLRKRRGRRKWRQRLTEAVFTWNSSKASNGEKIF